MLAIAADGVPATGDGPEALGVIDLEVDDVTSVLGAVDETEVVATGFCVAEVGGEERGGEGISDVGEEGLLGLGFH